MHFFYYLFLLSVKATEKKVAVHLPVSVLLNFDNKNLSSESEEISAFGKSYDLDEEPKPVDYIKLTKEQLAQAMKQIFNFLEKAQKENNIYISLTEANFFKDLNRVTKLQDNEQLKNVAAIELNPASVYSIFYAKEEDKKYVDDKQKNLRIGANETMDLDSFLKTITLENDEDAAGELTIKDFKERYCLKLNFSDESKFLSPNFSESLQVKENQWQNILSFVCQPSTEDEESLKDYASSESSSEEESEEEESGEGEEPNNSPSDIVTNSDEAEEGSKSNTSNNKLGKNFYLGVSITSLFVLVIGFVYYKKNSQDESKEQDDREEEDLL